MLGIQVQHGGHSEVLWWIPKCVRVDRKTHYGAFCKNHSRHLSNMMGIEYIVVGVQGAMAGILGAAIMGVGTVKGSE